VQGLVITLGVLFAYQYSLRQGGDEHTTRAMVFTTLVFANILLSLVNRSFVHSVLSSFQYRNPLFGIIIGATLVMLFAILYIGPIAEFFQVTGLSLKSLGTAFLIAAVSVLWFEGYKGLKRSRKVG